MFLKFKSNIKYIVFGLCPKGTTNLSPGFRTCLAPLERSSSGDFGYETGGALGAGGG